MRTEVSGSRRRTQQAVACEATGVHVAAKPKRAVRDFWMVTESALVFACRSLNLACHAQTREELMESYLHLEIFSDVQPALAKLARFKLAILSNGSPRMLSAAVESAGLNGVFTDE